MIKLALQILNRFDFSTKQFGWLLVHCSSDLVLALSLLSTILAIKCSSPWTCPSTARMTWTTRRKAKTPFFSIAVVSRLIGCRVRRLYTGGGSRNSKHWRTQIITLATTHFASGTSLLLQWTQRDQVFLTLYFRLFCFIFGNKLLFFPCGCSCDSLLNKWEMFQGEDGSAVQLRLNTTCAIPTCPAAKHPCRLFTFYTMHL